MKFLILFLITFFSFVVLYFTNIDFVLFRALVSLLLLLAVGISLAKEPVFRQDKYSIILFLFALINLLFLSPKVVSLNILLFFGMVPFLKPASYFIVKTEKFKFHFLVSFFCLLGFTFMLFLRDASFSNIHSRFGGFSGSGTTFSTYLLSMFAIYLFLERRAKIKLAVVLVTGFLIYVSQTRISFLLLILVLTIHYGKFSKIRKIKFLFIAILIFCISLYPVIILADSYIDLDITDRYEETDYSTYTRLNYYQNQVNALSNQNVFSLFFGNGIDAAKEVGSSVLGREVDQHNDFFTLLFDYGIIFFILFLTMLFRLVHSPLVLCVCSIYLFSFYHNMVFDIFLIFLIFLSNRIESEESKFNLYGLPSLEYNN